MLNAAFKSYMQTEVCSGAYNPEVETDWNVYVATLIRVGASLKMDQPIDAEVDNLPPTPIVLPPVVPNVIPPSGFSGDDNKPPPGSCWQFTHAGTCDLDEKDCRTHGLGMRCGLGSM